MSFRNRAPSFRKSKGLRLLDIPKNMVKLMVTFAHTTAQNKVTTMIPDDPDTKLGRKETAQALTNAAIRSRSPHWRRWGLAAAVRPLEMGP